MSGLLEERRRMPCAIIPDVNYVLMVVVGIMFFTYFLVPRLLPDATDFKGDSDEYRMLISSLHWVAVFVALQIYYPSNARRIDRDYYLQNDRARNGVVTCTPDRVDLGSSIGGTIDPVNSLIMFYTIVKTLSFFLVTAMQDAAPETKQLVRIMAGFGEVIAVYMYLLNYHEIAQADVQRRAMHTRQPNYRRSRRYNYSFD